jgi:hypothetical protein
MSGSGDISAAFTPLIARNHNNNECVSVNICLYIRTDFLIRYVVVWL